MSVAGRSIQAPTISNPQDNAEDAQKTGISAPLSEAPVYTQVTRG